LKIVNSSLNILNMASRLPFKYGIATLTSLPHLFVRLEVEIDGQLYSGTAADGLAPKWFTKNPHTSFKEDIEEMLLVINKAVEIAEGIEAETAFDFWLKVYQEQEAWGNREGLAPLLTSFGVSLVERALVEVACKACEKSFHQALREGDLGFDIMEIYPELDPGILSKALPDAPSNSIFIRHTVGLADPIINDDILISEIVDDSLPQSLQQCVDAYGLRYFKIKVSGNLAKDRERLQSIEGILRSIDYSFTLDGNEFFKNVETFKLYWESLNADETLHWFMSRLIVVEQPFHRSIALSETTAKEMLAWQGRPELIIDESDGELHSGAEGLRKGYTGTSFKNCKGLFKGVANACLVKAKGGILTAEDLCNVGPVALLQDLAVVASLGLTHVERNGHHYMKGLSMFPETIQASVLENHEGLYEQFSGFPVLDIADGQINLSSINTSPLGVGFDIDSLQFTALKDWNYDSLGL
jgi:hypothetical protein